MSNFKINTNVRASFYNANGDKTLLISLTKQQTGSDYNSTTQVYAVCGLTKSKAYKGYENDNKALFDSHVSYPQVGASVNKSQLDTLATALSFVFDETISVSVDYDNI